MDKWCEAVLERDAGYWRKLVADSSNFVKYYHIVNRRYESRNIQVSQETANAFLNHHGCTASELFGSVFALYLARINRMGGCLLQTNLRGEESEASDRRTLMRIDVNQDGRFTELIRDFRTAYATAAEHTKDDIEKYLGEMAFGYAVYDHTGAGNAEAAPAPFHDGQDDGTVLAMEIGDQALVLRYHTEVFQDVFIDHMAKNLESLIASVLKDPEQSISDIDILSEEEKALLSTYTKGKTIEMDPNVILSQSFREHARKNPDVIAVDDGVHQISYGDLEKKSNSIALELAERYQIGPGSIVALMLPRTYHFPMLVLALNKIGAAYVPVDLRLPMNRIQHMLQISQTEHLITTRAISETLQIHAKIIHLEDLKSDRDAEVEILGRIDSLCSIYFTSGTTGVPKGVMLYNRQAPWGSMAYADLLHVMPGDTIGSFLSFGFIASCLDYSVLYLGCTLRLLNEGEQRDSLLLMKALKETHMKSLLLPPVIGIPMYQAEELNLDYLILGGAKVNELGRKDRKTRLVNVYGTTEVTIAIAKIYNSADIQKDRISMGRPVPNTWAYVLDAEGRQLPVGVPGEICIAGGACSTEYCNDPALTEKSFVPNPFAEGEINAIMYRTGDIGYYNFDGEIEIIGREDNQLSVRGFRIEANEILGIMKDFSGIEETYLDVENDTLIAYYTAKEAVDLEGIKEALKRELPYYMIPSLFIRLEKIPLNLNGKIDKAQLKTAVKREQIEIADETLHAVIDAFREVLRVDQVGVDDEFVALGGNSLSAMKLLLILNEKLGVSLSANELMGLSTPMDIVQYIKNNVSIRSAAVENKYTFDGACPLTECQLNVYLDEQVHEMGTAYNNPFKITFADGKQYTPEKIKNALSGLIEAFPVLRARVIHQDDELRFVFDAEPEIAEGTADAVASFVRPFETDKGLARFLIAADGENTVLCADFHHLIFDGTSLNVLLRRLFALLNGEEAGAADRGVLREAAFEEGIVSERMEEAHGFFDRMLADQEGVYPLLPSVKGPEDPEETPEYFETFELDPEVLRRFLKTHAMTENQFFAGVFAYTLAKYSGSEKVLFNLIEDGRGHIDLSDSVGMYVKTLPMLMDCRNREIASFLADASELVNTAMKHDLYPFRLLAKEYNVQANIMFQYSHQLFDDAIHQPGMEYAVEELKHDPTAAFSFFIFHAGENRMGIRMLSSSRYAKTFIERFAASYRMILDGMMRETRLGDIQYTADSDLEIMNRYNQTEMPLRYDDLLDAFNDNLAKYPGNKLVEYRDVSYTWAEGAWIADQIRQKLLELGCGGDEMIGFLIPRSEGYLFSALGILALGAAYVPLDDTLPDERIAFMIQDTGERVLIVSDETLNRARELAGEEVALLNLSDILRTEHGWLEKLPADRGNVACILYTSGSTGVPKGVKITRKALNSFIDFHTRDLGILPGDVIGHYASIGFDVSMEDMFGVLVTGACLNVIPNDVRLDIQALNAHLIKYHIDYVHISTQIARLFISQIEETSLKTLITGGEKLGKVEAARKYRIVDSYGPTETCVYVTRTDLKNKIEYESVGPVIGNTKAYVLDSERRRVPIGAVGGLYIAGVQLADGYLNRKKETKKAFILNPFENSEEYRKLYDTGDTVWILPDGTYGFIGRRDGQVKIRGNRVELSEVEAAIRKLEAVRDVTAQVINQDGNNELIAYVVSDLEEEALRKAVTEELSGRVPAYMIPSFVIRMDRIPVNVNGKVDKKALPGVDFGRYQAAYAAPQDETETIVVSAFEQVFQQQKIGVNDDFVRLGGDSLTAVKMLMVLKEKGNVMLSANELIGLSTPKKIADHIRNHLHTASASEEDKYTFDGLCPLSESQLNVYLDETVHEMGTAYNTIFRITFRDREQYPPEKIRNALGQLVEAFPALRARVVNQDGSLFFAFDVEPAIFEGKLEEISAFAEPFETDRGLSRFLITAGPETTVLHVDVHHLIFDGASLNVLLSRLFAILNGEASGAADRGILRNAAFEESVGPERMEEAHGFFDRMLADQEGAYPLLPSVKGPEDPEETPEYFETFELDLEALKGFLKTRAMTENQFFAGVFAYTLAKYSGSEKALFNLIEDGRGHIDLSDSVGMYVKTLPMLMDCKDRETASFLADASELVNTAMTHDLYPFRLLAKEYDIQSDILFQYSHDLFFDAIHLEGPDYDIDMMKHDPTAAFSFFIFHAGEKRMGIRILASSQYAKAFVDRFAASYRMILDGMMREKRLGDIQYTTDSDLEIMNRYNRTETPLRYNDLLDAFNDNLVQYPGNKLVEFRDVSCTWAEGAWITDQIRQKLLELGCGAGEMIGFLIPRSEGYLFSALGILALGAAYVPLDDTLPDERIAFMIRDTGARVMIVSDETLNRARELAGEEVALLNLSDILRMERGRLEKLPADRGDIACILYTSGSTGIPKGVKITRKALNSFLDFNVRDLGILPGDVVGLYASIGFDVSMESMFSVLYTGACLDVIPEDVRLNIQAMNAHLMKYHVDYVHISTQIARLFISQIEETSLKALILGGEKLGRAEETRNYRIVDTYGPTEACDYITSIDLREKIDAGSVGCILDNAKAYILDSERRRAPIGAVGVLYLSGAQLADGYLNREEETARAFPDNPYEDSAEYGKIYDTGDVSRMLPDGTYDIIGRRDGQVKIRGNRVELSEVEAAIRKLEAVRDVTAQVVNRDGNNELIAYAVSELEEEALGSAVTEHLSGRVPAYMIPSFVIKVDRIPVNVNGKVDKKALPAVDFGRYQTEYAAPRNEQEKLVASAFEQVFQREKVSVNDDFIRLGGDSLTAMKLVSILGEYGVSVLDIMGLRTPEAIAKRVNLAANLPFDLDLYSLESGCPLNNAQLMLFEDIIRNQKFNTYLLPVLIPIPKKYSIRQILNALNRVFAAHPILSMRVGMREDGPWLVKGKKPTVLLEPFNPERVFTLLTKHFDIFERMARCVIVQGDESNYLAAVFHHLIFDAISDNLFQRVFLLALDGAALDYVDTEFLKLSAFHQQMKTTDEYTQVTQFAQLAMGDLEGIGFLVNPGADGKTGILQRELEVDPALLEQFIARTGVNKNILFTAILGCALFSLTGQDQVLYGSLDHGRDRLGQYDAIGLFINVLPIMPELDGQSVASFLEELSEMYYQMLQYNFFPFGVVAQQFGVKPMVVFQYFPDWISGTKATDQLQIDDSAVNEIVSRMDDYIMDALVDLVQKGDRYTLRIFNSSYYSREIMETLAETYQRMLTRIIGSDPSSDLKTLLDPD